MVMARFCFALIGAVGFVCASLACAPVHDATPASCPMGQEPSGSICVCVSTQAAPVDGQCLPANTPPSCKVEDCVDDGNPCTEPTCLTGADTCSNEPVANSTDCDVEGEAGTCVSGTCTVEPPPEWKLGTPFVIGGGGGEIVRPRVAVDGNGNAIAVWSEGDALMAAHLDTNEGWGDPLLLEEDFEPGRGFHIDVDAAGNAIVVYARVETASIDVRAVRYDYSLDTWELPDVLSRPGVVASSPAIAITADGQAVATWWEASDMVLLARTATNWLTWEEPVVVSPTDGLDKSDPLLSLAETGQGAVIYRGYGPGGNIDRVWVTPIGPGDSVGTPFEVHRSTQEIQSVKIAAAHDGELMALWQQNDDIWHARFSNGQWDPAALVETSGDSACCQEVAWGGSGAFFAVWIQSAGLRARRFSPEQGWGDTATFKDLSGARRPSLATTPGYDAFMAWHDRDEILLRHFNPDSGWSSFESIGSGLARDAPVNHRVDLARGSDGTIVAVWADEMSVWAWVDAR
jgi:hypothetical protein